MKKIITLLLALTLILSLFTVTALAKKPEGKPGGPPDAVEQNDDEEDGEDQDKPEKTKKPNEKRDAKMAFKEAVKPLLAEVRANREEWGLIGEGMDGLDESIEAKIELIKAGGIVMDEATLAIVQGLCDQFKDLNAQVRGLKREIQTLWKSYINAKKASDIDAATSALNALIAKQELRIGIRSQIAALLAQIDASLELVVNPPAVEPEAPVVVE